jgi:anti-anti-sigma regulatory factor
MKITQRHVTLAILGMACIGSILFNIASLIVGGGDAASSLPISIVATFIIGGLWFLYWQGWEYARYITVVFITLATVFALPPRLLTAEFASAIVMPPVLALIMASPTWIIGSGAAMIILLITRAGGQGIYTQPMTIIVYMMIVGGMALARIITETAKQTAEKNARQAEEALIHTEQQAKELEEANMLLTVQLDQQDQLLQLVATLETPVLTLAEGVLFAPIVGHIDSRRAQSLTQRLLDEAHNQRARMIIIDVSGVPVMDTAVAKALMNSVQSLRLLGCDVTISGISATVALTLTQLGIDLKTVAIARSPREAVAHYLGSAAMRGAHRDPVLKG